MTESLSRDQLLEIDYYLRLTRTLEERLVALFRQAKVIGGLYRSLGQEGESVAAAYALDFKQGEIHLRANNILTPHALSLAASMGHAALPVRRRPRVAILANGDELVPPGATPGPDQIVSSNGFIGQISMLGDMIPVMAGIALAGRMQKKSLVTMAFIGDGGSSTGAFYEGMNFASVQKLPMVVVIEDNAYAYSTPVAKQTAARTLADKAHAFGCRGVTVDGNDVFAVHRAAKEAIDHARAGGGVTLLEVKTFRLKGHAEHDNQSYVPQEIIDESKGVILQNSNY